MIVKKFEIVLIIQLQVKIEVKNHESRLKTQIFDFQGKFEGYQQGNNSQKL